MILSLIVALTKNKQVIGKENSLPWKLPQDLKHFKEITSGHPIIMGRKTYDSIGRPLPGRRNIVISRQENLEISGCEVMHSLDEALKACEKSKEVFVIGGSEIFSQALPKAQRLYLTWIEKDFDGDVFFPPLALKEYNEVFRQHFSEPFPFTFVNYERA